ncbi:Cna B-type domain-containing protein [Blautia luti]|uniref:Cna B-type domain-containing protein n=1 Tax=Blautia luti TaxID=89014 RepID=UPI0018A95DF5|nr:Cna B-type domain-containing protein [Blautia luti]
MNKKNKAKRYLAGLLTVLMIFQQSGMNSILADSDEIPVTFAAEEELAGYDEVQEYEGQAQVEETVEEPVTEEVMEEEPIQPEETEEPEEPSQPEESGEPEEPSQPEEPGEPEDPSQPEESGDPEETMQPEEPGDSEEPEQPEITEIPELTATPEPEQTEVPKTDFSYEDESIFVTAAAEESAGLPQDAQLKVENLLNTDPQRYEGEKSEMNSLLGIDGEIFTAEYLLYDIYFWSETAGGRVEPADGSVKVQMNFTEPQLVKNTQEQIVQSNLKVYVNRQEDTAAQFDTNEAEAVQGAAFSAVNMGTAAIIRINEMKKNEQFVYTYEDSEVVVTATLAAPDAVPDEAEFRVTRVTPQTAGYNYDVYMQALNNNAEMISPDNSANGQESDVYTEKNTLLYDIAFLVDKTDENGNVIPGEKEEYQPTEGAVNISFDFKKSQLTQEVEAEKAEEIAVVHLPLDEATKESVDTTADATDISAGNINVEVVSEAEVQLETEAADFDLNNFSLVAFVNVNGQELNPGTLQNYWSILGNAIYYGVTANTINKDAHMDTNFATKYFTGSGNVTAGAYTGNNGDANNGGVYVIADMSSDSSLKIDGKNSDVWCTDAIKDRLSLEVDGKGQKTIFAKGALEVYVDRLIASVSKVSASMADEVSYQVKNQNEVMNQAEIDISERPEGTYYIDGDWLNDISEGALRIKKKSDQTIVFNYKGTSVNLKRFEIWDTDRESGYMQSTTSSASADQYARTVVFNMPNATDVTFASGMFGIFLAPKATVHGLGGTSSGWLVVDTLDKNGSEWHCVWSDMPDSSHIPVPAQLTAIKTVNGDRPGDDEKFRFKLEIYNKEWRKWAQVEILPNKGNFVTFTSMTFRADGQYYYRISEYGEVDGYIKDDTVYIAVITVSSDSQISGDTTITSYKIDSVKYYRASDLEEVTEDNLVPAAAFDNTRQEEEKIETSVCKEWDDADNQDGKRPQSILVQLYANGQKLGEPVVLNEGNGWSYGWSDLPVKQDGQTVVYSLKEVGRIPGYESTVTGDVQTGFVITNSHTPELTNISGEKIWDDGDNQDGKRPESITVNLLANGQKTDSKVVKADKEGNWSYTFQNLPKYANGEPIIYTVTEDTVTDYTTEVTGTTITNKYQPGKTSITVTKAWEDFNDHNGIRPSEIKVQLYADGEAQGEEITLNAENQWTHIWTDLDERKAGELIDYTVKETENTDNYETTISGDAHTGYIITNTLKTGNLELEKLITGDLSDEKLTAEEKEALTFTITGPYDYQETVYYSDFTDGKYLLSSLPLGEYQVIEANAKIPGYVLTADYSVEEGTTEILHNETATVTITNNYETTSVKISKVDITSHEELEGAHLQIIDQEGNIVDEWDSTKTAHETTGLRTGETYILRETVAPDDYNITNDTTFELNEDGTINTEKTTTTIKDGILLVEDTMKEYSDADLTVTKHLTTNEGEEIKAVDQTFYVALYADEDCTERVSDIKPLVFQNASVSSVTFTKLEKDHTYYVGECDEEGTSYLANVTADGTLYTVEFHDGNVVEIDNPDGSKAIYFDNQFEEIPDNFYRDGKLIITKKLLRADGKAKNSSQTFYAGIFADEEYTQFAEEAEEKIVALDLAGNSKVSRSVTIALPNEGNVTLYVTEVDSAGKPVDGATGFKYEISVENAEITLNQENYQETVEITNKETTPTPTPKPSSTPTPTVTPAIPTSNRTQKTPGSFTGTSTRTAVKTGDTTPIDGFIALLAAAAVVTAAGVYFKRRRKAK